MRRGSFLVVLVVLLLAVGGCGSITSLIPGFGDAGTRVDALWPDVPQIPGSERVDTDLPLPAQLLLQGWVAAANSQAESGDFRPENGEFVVYQMPGTGTDLPQHYPVDVMADNGWTGAEGTCGSSPVAEVGGLCAYQRSTDTGADEFLLIVLLPGEGDGGVDQVAYLRFSGTTAP